MDPESSTSMVVTISSATPDNANSDFGSEILSFSMVIIHHFLLLRAPFDHVLNVSFNPSLNLCVNLRFFLVNFKAI